MAELKKQHDAALTEVQNQQKKADGTAQQSRVESDKAREQHNAALVSEQNKAAEMNKQHAAAIADLRTKLAQEQQARQIAVDKEHSTSQLLQRAGTSAADVQKARQADATSAEQALAAANSKASAAEQQLAAANHKASTYEQQLAVANHSISHVEQQLQLGLQDNSKKLSRIQELEGMLQKVFDLNALPLCRLC